MGVRTAWTHRLGIQRGSFTAARVILVLMKSGMVYIELSHSGEILSRAVVTTEGVPDPGMEIKYLTLRADNQLVAWFVGPNATAHYRWDASALRWTEAPAIRGRTVGFSGGRALVASQSNRTWSVGWRLLDRERGSAWAGRRKPPTRNFTCAHVYR